MDTEFPVVASILFVTKLGFPISVESWLPVTS
jgi:hypothetical protein